MESYFRRLRIHIQTQSSLRVYCLVTERAHKKCILICADRKYVVFNQTRSQTRYLRSTAQIALAIRFAG
jgi:hypothetical protein